MRWAPAIALIGLLLGSSTTGSAHAASRLDALQQQVERHLNLAQARGSISRHQLLALRARMSTIVKEKQSLTHSRESNRTKQPTEKRLILQLSAVDRQIYEAQHPSLASQLFRYF